MDGVEEIARRARFVLVRPRKAGNIGAVARLLANVGLCDLVLVAPQTDPLGEEALRQSSRAEPILRAARVVGGLTEALDGVAWTVATTCRPGLYRAQAQLSPRELARSVVATPRRVAILFGPEDRGLTNEDLLCCDATLRIPTHPQYESLNLAQAAMIVAYELYVAAVDAGSDRAEGSNRPGDGPALIAPPTLVTPPAPGYEEYDPESLRPADGAAIARMMEKFREPLAAIGYLDPQKPEHLLMALRSIFARASLTRRDVRTLIGLAQQIERFGEEARPPRAPGTTPRDSPGTPEDPRCPGC
jgi:TrmH family RNA methyltransferase